MASLSSSNYKAFPLGFSAEIQLVPAVAADLATKDAMLWQLNVVNTTAGALTITMTDKQATPRYILPAVSIAANTAYVVSWPEGLFCDDGINWVASGVGLQASVVGTYRAA